MTLEAYNTIVEMKWLLTEAFQNHKTLDKKDIELVKKFVHTQFVSEEEYWQMVENEKHLKKERKHERKKQNHKDYPRGC